MVTPNTHVFKCWNKPKRRWRHVMLQANSISQRRNASIFQTKHTNSIAMAEVYRIWSTSSMSWNGEGGWIDVPQEQAHISQVLHLLTTFHHFPTYKPETPVFTKSSFGFIRTLKKFSFRPSQYFTKWKTWFGLRASFLRMDCKPHQYWDGLGLILWVSFLNIEFLTLIMIRSWPWLQRAKNSPPRRIGPQHGQCKPIFCKLI